MVSSCLSVSIPVRTDLISVYLSPEWRRVSTDTKCDRDNSVSFVDLREKVQCHWGLDRAVPSYIIYSLAQQLQVFLWAPRRLGAGPQAESAVCTAVRSPGGWHSRPQSLWVLSAFALPQPGLSFYRTVPRGDVVESEERGRVVRHRPEPCHWHTGPPCT